MAGRSPGGNVLSVPQRHYDRAPITEAIIDVRTDLPSETDLSCLSTLPDNLQKLYPHRKTKIDVHAELSAGAKVGATASQIPAGYMFLSADERQVVHFNVTGFAFGRLAPYDRWEAFEASAAPAWDAYCAQSKPVRATRTALRYVNRIELPLPFEDLKEFLRTVPEVAPELPQSLSGFFMQLQIPQADIGATLSLTQAMVQPVNPNTVAIVLDIDLFNESNVDIGRVWEIVSEMRDKKNHVFESCITDRLRELIS